MSVTVAGIAFSDPRFSRLAQILALADADHARSKMEWLWLDCTTRGETCLPQWLVEQRLGTRGPEALIESELARWSRGRGDSKTRTLYIRGAQERTSWKAKLQEQSSKGGKARARNTSRMAGRFTSQVDGESTSPPTPTPTPTSSPIPTPTGESEKNSAAPSAGGLRLESPGLAELKAKVDRARKPKPSEASESELAAVSAILGRLTKRNGVRYSGSQEHVRLIVGRLRDGCTEHDLRKVIAYCAEPKPHGLGWSEGSDMAAYLRPETLFGPKTIAKYLDPARSWYAKQFPEDEEQAA